MTLAEIVTKTLAWQIVGVQFPENVVDNTTAIKTVRILCTEHPKNYSFGVIDETVHLTDTIIENTSEEKIIENIDNRVIAAINSVIGDNIECTYDPIKDPFQPENDQFQCWDSPNLEILINKLANKIAQRTRRGVGNFVLVNSEGLNYLISSTRGYFARFGEGYPGKLYPKHPKHQGILLNMFDVYLVENIDGIIIGYKGEDHIFLVGDKDSGVIYVPHKLSENENILTDAIFMLSNEDNALGNAASYYCKIVVNKGEK